MQNLREWTRNNACIAREETAFLEQARDLVSIVSPKDDALDRTEEVLEDAFLRLCGLCRKVCRIPVGRCLPGGSFNSGKADWRW